jgi:hypothetical protein
MAGAKQRPTTATAERQSRGLRGLILKLLNDNRADCADCSSTAERQSRGLRGLILKLLNDNRADCAD